MEETPDHSAKAARSIDDDFGGTDRMLIDIKTGRVELPNGLIVHPGISLREYEKSELWRISKFVAYHKPPCYWFEVPALPLGELSLSVWLRFDSDMLKLTTLRLTPPHLAVRQTIEEEFELGEYHTQYLLQTIGSPPYRYSWGQIEAKVHDLGIQARIFISYQSSQDDSVTTI